MSKPRRVWSHAEVGKLVTLWNQGGEASIEAAYPSGAGVNAAKAKLIEMEFMPKPEDEQLAIEVHQDIETFVSELTALTPRQAVLAMRATMQACRESGVLPTRKKAVTA